MSRASDDSANVETPTAKVNVTVKLLRNPSTTP